MGICKPCRDAGAYKSDIPTGAVYQEDEMRKGLHAQCEHATCPCQHREDAVILREEVDCGT